MSLAEKYTTLTTEKIPAVYEAGKQDERKEFWEQFYKVSSWAYSFYGKRWNDDIYTPPDTIKPAAGTSVAAMYQGSRITNTKVLLDLSGVTSGGYCFYEATSLKTIMGIIFPNTSFSVSNWFTKCSELEDIKVYGEISITGLNFKDCTKLNHNSITCAEGTGIMDVLSPTATDMTLTLPLEAINREFETSQGANDGSTSTEWIALKNSKSNWFVELA